MGLLVEAGSRHAEFKSAVADHIQRRRVFGNMDRMCQREDPRCRGDADAACARGDRRAEAQGRGEKQIRMLEMPLGENNRVEAELSAWQTCSSTA